MKVYDDKMKPLHGYMEGKADAIDSESNRKALEYKKNFLKNFISINQNQINQRLGGDKYYVTKKYDGEYAVIFYENGQAVTINRSGRVRSGIPCIEEAAALCRAAGLKQAIIPAEIYVDSPGVRSRVNDLLTVLADSQRLSELKLAAFDIVEIDYRAPHSASFADIYRKLESIFKNGKLCHPVRMLTVNSADQVKALFERWVNGDNAEGLVVRSDLPLVFKIKPRHSVDVVVVGFTEGTGDMKGQIRTLLTALMPGEGLYQIIGKTGGGFTDSLRKKLFKELSATIIPSRYIETDSNHVAFHMVKPETVIQININDVLYDTNSGTKMNPLLQIENGTYRLHSTVEGFKFIAPFFEKLREDKRADASDVRVSQIQEFSYREPEQEPAVAVVYDNDLPASELLRREVYRKTSGSKIMVQKYLVWKTNKEKSGLFPSYVMHYTNFSTQRLEPLQRDVFISESYDQIMELTDKALRENVKKGWEFVPVESALLTDPSQGKSGTSKKKVKGQKI